MATASLNPTLFPGEASVPVIARSGFDVNLELCLPVSVETPWLTQLRRMRGEVIYDHGHRPAFLNPDGELDDPDPHDFNSFHIVARCGEKIGGGVRFTALEDPHRGAVPSVIGMSRFNDQIRDLRVNPVR